MQSKTCKSCEEEFDPRCTTQVYCSDECRVKGIRYQPVEKICAREECSTAFKTTQTHQNKIYCSRSCSAVVNNSKSPKRQKTVRREEVCSFSLCGKPLVKRSSLKYCSVQCQVNSRQQEKLDHWLETGEGSINSSVTSYIRSYLYRDQDYKCSVCKMPNLWQEVELKLVLDHIDGNAENNNRENLRLVCPNCDSQLPTFKAKNAGNGRHWRRERYAAGKSY